MYSKLHRLVSNNKYFMSIALLLSLTTLSACGNAEGEAEGNAEAVFLEANPAVGAVMDYPPRTLRVFLTELPEIEASSLKLKGPNGEVPLSRFHTMGANDLMIEIDDYPLPNGEYTVEWSAKFVGGTQHYSGRYQFTVAAEQ